MPRKPMTAQKRIRIYRHKHGAWNQRGKFHPFSLRKMQERCGVSWTTLGDIENGEMRVCENVARKLATLFGLERWDLLVTRKGAEDV